MGMRTRWWALTATVLGLAAAAPPASAAFPGANGRLAVTPLSGGGLLIASPQTGRARRACDAPQTCGAQPTGARFSPNGREILFTDGSGRLEVMTQTGTCVWCLNATPRWDLRGSGPAFTPDGAAVTYVHNGLWKVTPGRPKPTRVRVDGGPGGRVSTAVWSPSGRPAVVRRGWLWTGVVKNGKVFIFNRLTRGSAPVWSPGGHELAFTHNGVVSTFRIGKHTITRIARGTDPGLLP